MENKKLIEEMKEVILSLENDDNSIPDFLWNRISELKKQLLMRKKTSYNGIEILHPVGVELSRHKVEKTLISFFKSKKEIPYFGIIKINMVAEQPKVYEYVKT